MGGGRADNLVVSAKRLAGRARSPTRRCPRKAKRRPKSTTARTGEFEFPDRDHLIKAAPDSFVGVPEGSLHTLKNTGEEVGRLLTLVVPAGLDKFFEEAVIPGTDVFSPPPPPGPEIIEKMLMSAERYGIELPPPPRH
jgi:hypothetical protein